jgi:AraC-like DNA-binding protein
MKEIPVRRISDSMPNQEQRFSIRSLESILNGKPMADSLHRHNYFFILVVKKGSGKHVIDLVPYPISDRTVFMLRPGQIHQLQMNPDCAGFLLQFDAAFYTPGDTRSKQRFRRASAKNHCVPGPEQFERIHAVLSTISAEYAAKQADYMELIRLNLEIFFIEFLRQSQGLEINPDAESAYAYERLEEFQELLEQHVAAHLPVGNYAEMLGISVYQLNKMTRNLIGKTVSEAINDQLVLESKRQLLGTSAQVKDVAYSLGFEDVSYFSRFFKKHTGSSPETFRNDFR